MIKLIKGFKDILPGETELWKDVIKTSVSLFNDFGYSEICTPIMEKTDLFTRSIGNGTDIVEKEMYTFRDLKGELITLRPEATASLVRAYIQHKMYATNYDKRLYTFGPMFRRERPQKGRYRQFYQLDVEVFGIESPYIDAELIFMLNSLLSKLSVQDTIIHLNSLGCSCCRPLFKTYLINFISESKSSLCSDCIRRKDHNPLRVLDCKINLCQNVILNAKSILDFLCHDCKNHFNEVIDLISLLGVPFKIDTNLVRGLDYYNRTTFEIHHTNYVVSGSNNAIAGGGRYDGLVRQLGGPDVPAIGFAIGLNRLVEMIGLNSKQFINCPDLFIAVLGNKAMKLAFEWQMKLNNSGVRVNIGRFKQSLKSQMKQANRDGASYVLIVGDQELDNSEVVFRCMSTGSQLCIPIDNIVLQIRNEILKLKDSILKSSSRT